MPYRDAFTGFAHVRRMMERFPRMRVCVAHMGCFEPQAFLALTGEVEHLYLDTTMALAPAASGYVGADPAAIATEQLLRHQDRILFGSDFPFLTAAETIAGLRDTGILDAPAMEGVLSGNASRLLAASKR